MDVFNRIKSTVTGALPGNPVTREFDIISHRASGGPGLLWKIYDGVKRSTKEGASVFVLEKKVLDRYSKHDKELIIDSLKKGVAQLTRLRHPKILSVLHTLEESRDSLAFATEPILASLANLLGSHDNLPAPVPADLKDYKLFDVEIKYGLLQITEGLAFLHNSVKLVHRNICPESIMVNKNGGWKLGGFDFCVKNANSEDQPAFYPFVEWSPEYPHVIQPSLEYLAPEHALTASCDVSADMFSLGVLFYSVYSGGRTIFNCKSEYPMYKQSIDELRRLGSSTLNAVPEEVREHLKMLLQTEPSLRPDADQLSKIPFFDDVGAMTLQYLDSLFQRDNLQKSQFFKGLPKVLAKLPLRVALQRVLVCLETACSNHGMVPFVLPNILLIAEKASTEEYVNHVLPVLRPLFQIKDPIQITLLFMQNMNLLLSKTPPDDIKTYVLPMVYRALEADMPQVQEQCLTILPTFVNLIEYNTMKNAIVPRIKKLCMKTTNLSIRVGCLICVGKLMEYMDKWFVLDEIFPILPDVPSREPAVLMSMLGIYQVAMTHKKLGVTKEALANKVLPFLFPLSIDNNLNLEQYNAFTKVIRDMMSKVETEHRGKLEQLNSMQQEQREEFPQLDSVLQDDGQMKIEADTMGPAIFPPPKSDNTKMGDFMADFGMKNSASDVSNGTAKDVAKTGDGKKATSLSMEEKKRLMREKENQQNFKKRETLVPKSSVSSSSSSAANAGSKDLLTSNISSRSSTTLNPSLNSVTSSAMAGLSLSSQSPANHTQRFPSSSGFAPQTGANFGGFAPQQSNTWTNMAPAMGNMAPTMGNMAPAMTNMATGMGTMTPAMGNMAAPMGNVMSNMAPITMNNMAAFGTGPPTNMAPVGMAAFPVNSNVGNMAAFQGGMSNMATQQPKKLQPLAKNDLDDLLG